MLGRDRQAEQAQLAHFTHDVRRHPAAGGQFVLGGDQAFVHETAHGVQQQGQGFGVQGHDQGLFQGPGGRRRSGAHAADQ